MMMKSVERHIKVGALIFARMDSTRLPGKSLMQLGGKALLKWPIDALKSWNKVKVIVATSDRDLDNPLEDLARTEGLDCYRGSIENVATRAMHAAEYFNLDYFYRINGDSPFINLSLLQSALDKISDGPADLVTNLITRTYPYGLSCELIRTENFKKSYKHFSESEKEHITSYFYKNQDLFNIKELEKLNENHTNLRWTVDTNEDLQNLETYLKESESEDIHHRFPNNVITDFNKKMKKSIYD